MVHTLVLLERKILVILMLPTKTLREKTKALSIWIIFKEHKHLGKWFLVLGVATIAGGATFPAQIILFPRTVQASQLEPGPAVKQGDFYSLMFFIVALGNLAVYAAVGWASNIVAQVRILWLKAINFRLIVI